MSAERQESTTIPPARDIPPPPADLVPKALAQAEAKETAEAAAADRPAVAAGGAIQADRPSRALLWEVRAQIFEFLRYNGGSSGEADDVATEMVAYVDFAWRSLGLGAVAANRQLWQRHLQREALGRWLAHLLRRCASTTAQDSVARRRFLVLAEAAPVDSEDRLLVERLWVNRFSVEETALALGLDPAELSARLRQALAQATSLVAAPSSSDIDRLSDYINAASCKLTPASGERRGGLGRNVQSTLSPAQLRAAWDLMVEALVRRGCPLSDAEDAAQEAFVAIMRTPEAYLDRLADIEAHKGWFVWLAMHRYLMTLRTERQRRRRELLNRWMATESGEEPPRRSPEADVLLNLAAEAPLTARQRAYLRAVLVDHLVIEDIAELTRTSPRAVRAVLQRAAERLRCYVLEEPGRGDPDMVRAHDRADAPLVAGSDQALPAV